MVKEQGNDGKMMILKYLSHVFSKYANRENAVCYRGNQSVPGCPNLTNIEPTAILYKFHLVLLPLPFVCAAATIFSFTAQQT